MLKLQKFVLTTEMLNKVPNPQRAVFIFGGHISNELTWFIKMTYLYDKERRVLLERNKAPFDSEIQARIDGAFAQEQMLVRLLAGKVQESLNFLDEHCFGRPWFEELLKRMEDEGKTAYAEIKKYMDERASGNQGNLIKLVRDKVAFHYDKKVVKQSSQLANADDFVVYLGDNVANSLYLGSELAVTNSVISSANIDDLLKGLGTLVNQTSNLSRSINRLLGHVIAMICFDFFGETFEENGHREEIQIESPSLSEVELPYFTGLLS